MIYGLHKDSADSAASSACGAGAGAAAVGMSIASSAPAADLSYRRIITRDTEAAGAPPVPIVMGEFAFFIVKFLLLL